MPIEITTENCQQYLEERVIKNLPFVVKNIISVEEITEQTYVNWIFRAILATDNGEKTVYLRQSRGFVKKKPNMQLDPARISFEVKILNLLQSINSGITPVVLYFDKENNVCVLEDIRGDRALLVNELVKGNPHPETGQFFGQVIAKYHGSTFGIKNEQVRGSDEENEKAIEFNLGMRTKPALKLFPKESQQFLNESNQAKRCLVLGDLASKNVMIGSDGKIRFLDLERAFVGDPAFDLAFLFCHYLLEVPIKNIDQSLDFIKEFMDGYKEEIIKYIPQSEAELLEKRAVNFLGITILYRLFGFYLVIDTDSDAEKWKQTAYQLLTNISSQSLPQILQQFIKY